MFAASPGGSHLKSRLAFTEVFFNMAGIHLSAGGEPQCVADKKASSRRLHKVLWADTGFPVSVKERGKCYHLEAAGARLPLNSEHCTWASPEVPALDFTLAPLPSHNQAELLPK